MTPSVRYEPMKFRNANTPCISRKLDIMDFIIKCIACLLCLFICFVCFLGEVDTMSLFFFLPKEIL